MNVNIELSTSLPDKTSRFEEWADEEAVRIEGFSEEYPNVQGNLVTQIQLLDKLFEEAREHLLLQMDDRTRAAMPRVVMSSDYSIPAEL